MPEDASRDVTKLLLSLRLGGGSAVEALFPLVYDELRALAASFFRDQPPGHTLEPTALVNEAYVRLVDPARIDARDRAQFFALAAKVMRSILIDHARAKDRQKRGGGRERITLAEALTPGHQPHTLELLALDEALDRLAELDERQARIIELRFFAGLSLEEMAEFLELSRATVSEELRCARAFLSRQLSQDGSGASSSALP